MQKTLYLKADVKGFKKRKASTKDVIEYAPKDADDILFQVREFDALKVNYSDGQAKAHGRSIGKTIFNFFFWIIFGIIILFQVVTLVDKSNDYNLSFFGYRSSVISSSSMSVVHESNKDRLEGLTDQYQKGDIVITQDVKSFDDFKVNDVVTYFDGRSLICHRVTDKVRKDDGTLYFITQGDKNNTNDGLIPFSRMRGKVVNSIPKLGWASLYLQSPYGLLAISSVALIVVVTIYLLSKPSNE